MACRTCSLSDIKWFYFSWFSIILHAKKPPRPRKLSSIRRGQFDAFRIPAYFFGRKRSKRDKIRQKNEHFLNKQTKNTFYIPYTPHAPLEAAAGAADADRETDTVTDLILLINAMQLLCCCCCCRCCSAGLSAASWRRCCCIQSAICNTISAQQRKNEVIGKWLSNGGRPSNSSNSSSSVATAWRTYIHIYSACHLVAATYILWSSHTKCLASWDYFLAAALLARQLAALCLGPCPNVACSLCR